METHAEQPHLVPYRVYVLVWLALTSLTGLTVGAHYADMGHMAIFTALFIASVKVTLVALYFMNLRYEKSFFGIMIVVVMITYMIFMFLTFSDYFFR